MVFLFTGNSSIYFQLFGNDFAQCLCKLLFGAYLTFPLVARTYLTLLPESFEVTLLSILYMLAFNLMGSFALSFILYLVVECPISDLLRMMISDIVKLIKGR